jgi:hypothetical protein
MERVSGPYKGYYIAAYTVSSGEGFAGYAKICTSEPANVWNAQTDERLISATGYRDEQDALLAAEKQARRDIAEIAGSPVTAPGALH